MAAGTSAIAARRSAISRRFVADYLELEGPAYTIATACSSSAKVFASAQRLIEAGLCDAAVVGGADTLCRMTLDGFDSLEALAQDYCNPFSRNRDGINIGEGAAVFPDDAPRSPRCRCSASAKARTRIMSARHIPMATARRSR